jgi:hypothetical protein
MSGGVGLRGLPQASSPVESVERLAYPACEGVSELPEGRVLGSGHLRSGPLMRDHAVVERWELRERACLRVMTIRQEWPMGISDVEVVFDQDYRPLRVWKRMSMPSVPGQRRRAARHAALRAAHHAGHPEPRLGGGPRVLCVPRPESGGRGGAGQGAAGRVDSAAPGPGRGRDRAGPGAGLPAPGGAHRDHLVERVSQNPVIRRSPSDWQPIRVPSWRGRGKTVRRL